MMDEKTTALWCKLGDLIERLQGLPSSGRLQHFFQYLPEFGDGWNSKEINAAAKRLGHDEVIRLVKAKNAPLVIEVLHHKQPERSRPVSFRMLTGDDMRGFDFTTIKRDNAVGYLKAWQAMLTAEKSDTSDTKTDTQKKSRKTRPPNDDAVRCGKLHRRELKKDPGTPLKSSVEMYVLDHQDVKFEGLYKRLLANPHLWKPTDT
jgi:hypothetical protein